MVSPCFLLEANGKNVGVGTHHIQDGRQGKGDVNTNGDAEVGDWREVFLIKDNLEAGRVHPRHIKA